MTKRDEELSADRATAREVVELLREIKAQRYPLDSAARGALGRAKVAASTLLAELEEESK